MPPPAVARVRAAGFDRRVPYYLRLPRGGSPVALLASVHGSDRDFIACAEWFADLADRHRLAIVSPLFAGGIGEPGNDDGYKYLYEDGIDYARLFLALLDEAAAACGCAGDQVLLFGYSGGGQFVHRFFYLHPERLRAVSIGAPGSVSMIDDAHPWWIGTADLADRFGRVPDVAALRRVPVQLLVGADDRSTAMASADPAGRYFMPGQGRAGATRVARIEALQRHLEGLSIDAALTVVPGVAHQGAGVVAQAIDFFERQLPKPAS